MGGSLGLAARERRLADRVVGYARREATREEALRLQAVDAAPERLEDAVREADTVVLCVPVLAIAELAGAIRPHLADGSVVTDVGSTKAELVASLEGVFGQSASSFVGSHPIAGSDQTGLNAAQPRLYEAATVVVTPTDRTSESAVRRVTALWEGLGGRVVRMAPAEHDRIIARTSHLPHLAAAALVSCVFRDKGEEPVQFCGSGFRDTTRVAAGSEDVWHDIVQTNRRFIVEELDEFGRAIERVKTMLERGEFQALRQFLAESREKRQRLGKARSRSAAQGTDKRRT